MRKGGFFWTACSSYLAVQSESDGSGACGILGKAHHRVAGRAGGVLPLLSASLPRTCQPEKAALTNISAK